MDILKRMSGICLASIAGIALAMSAHAAPLPGLGQLTGNVTGSTDGVLPVVYALNTDRDVAYTVFVVGGKYRAVNLIPGPYKVTIRPAVDQLEGFAPQTVSLQVAANMTATADFELRDVGIVKSYAGGLPYEACSRDEPDCGASIEPYDSIFPAGAGREIMERTCFGCHTPQLFAYNHVRGFAGGRAKKDKAAWGITVDRMHKQPAFGRQGKATMFDPVLLPPKDRDIVVDYLATNFGADAPSRVVQLTSEARLDLRALEKAMFVEYIYREDPAKYPEWPWPHQIDFDKDGNVWLAYTQCCIVRFDPRTGEARAYEGNGGGHGIVVDQTDQTVWYSGDVVRHLDPVTGLVDNWKIGSDRGLGSNTQIFDSKGNLWLSLLAGGALGKWDRKTNNIDYWEVPVLRSRPYGIIVDYKDKVWFADYHNGGVTRFDPDTEQFKHFNLVPYHKEKGGSTAVSQIRRPGVDSKGMIWAATWGSYRMQNAALYRLNPDTGEVMERKLGIEYANPYNAEADPDDNIWVATDNHLSKYDQEADAFTHYPIPVRSDTLKTTITRDGAVWFIYRNAGKYDGYGGSAAVLYPDKDRITTLAAYHDANSAGYLSSKHRGAAPPKVTGGNKLAPSGARNADEYTTWSIANGLMPAPKKIPAEPDTKLDSDRY